MKKISLSFTVDDHYEELAARRAINADGAYLALFDIQNEIFRPARKHGYSDAKINELIENCGGEKDDSGEFAQSWGEELIEALENRFLEILLDNGVSLEDIG